MNKLSFVFFVLFFTLTPAIASAQPFLPDADASEEFVELRLTLNGEAERIDQLEHELTRDLSRLRTTLRGLGDGQEALRAQLEAHIADAERQLAEIPQMRQDIEDLRAAINRGNLERETLRGLINNNATAINDFRSDFRLFQTSVNNSLEEIRRDIVTLQHRSVRFGFGLEVGGNSDRHAAFTGGITLGLRYGIQDNTFGVVHARVGTASDGWDLEPTFRLTWLASLSERWAFGGGLGAWLDSGALNAPAVEAFAFSALAETRVMATQNLEFHLNVGPAIALAKGGQGIGFETNVGATWWF